MPSEDGRPFNHVNVGERVGDLYFLRHPTTPDTFSGYGLVERAGRRDHLAGLLMVDRPEPADPSWLAEVEEMYGGYQLVTMAATGERGILCRMRIVRDSIPYLNTLSSPKAEEIRRALRPLLEHPPDPILKVRWAPDAGMWQSQFWIGLPQAIQEVFDRQGYGCFPVERDDRVGLVTSVPEWDIQSFRGAPVQYTWQLIEMPTAPLIRFQASILDHPDAPYVLEHFLNIGDPEQAAIVGRLTEQRTLVFDFFGDDYEYRYSKEVDHPQRLRAHLRLAAALAMHYWTNLPEARRDFDRAKAEYQRRYPLIP